MEGYKLVLDVSHHQTFNYDEVKKHIDGVIIRFGFGTQADTMCDKHYDGFKELPCAGYQWFRPDQDVKAQIELVKVKTANKGIRVFFSDQEQRGHWIWGADVAPYYPSYQLSEFARAHVEGLKLHGFDMGVYSRASWITSYAQPMWNWMFMYYTWLASWPYATGSHTTSWESLMTYWAPKSFSPYYTSTWPVKKTEAWQWSGDKFVLPGVYTNPSSGTPVPRSCDLNYVSDALFAKFTEPVLPPPPPPVVQPPPLTLEERVTAVEKRVESAYSEIDGLQAEARRQGWAV